MKKPRSDSPLRTLPAARQAVICDYALGHSLAETVEWLRADGLTVSSAALSGWLSSYRLAAQMQRNESTVETLLQKLQVARPDWSPEQIQTVGQSFFTALALEQQDPKQWFMIQQTAIKKEQLSLDRQKFQRETVELFLKWRQSKEAEAIASSNAPHAEKIEKLGQQMFGDLW